jgi:hypothetical protein
MTLFTDFEFGPLITGPGTPVIRGKFFGGATTRNARTVAAFGTDLISGQTITSSANPAAGVPVPSTTPAFLPVLTLHNTTANQNVPPFKSRLIRSANMLSITRVRMHGNLALCLSANNDRFTLVDYTDPLIPVERGTVTNATTLDDPRYVAVSGNYAFVTCFERLTVIDISNPSSISIVATVSDSTNLRGAGGIAIVGTTAFIFSGTAAGATLSSWDISTPTSTPTLIDSEVGQAGGGTDTIMGLVVIGSAAFGFIPGRIAAFNISTPSAITLTSVFPHSNLNMTTGGTDQSYLAAIGTTHLAAANDGSIFMSVISVSNPSSMSMAGSVSNATSRDVCVIGSRVYTPSLNPIDCIYVHNITSPTSPSLVGQLFDPGYVQHSSDVNIANGSAMVFSNDGASSRGRALAAIDITTDVSNPSVIGSVVPGGLIINEATVAAKSGNILFLGDRGTTTISSYDVTNPASPTLISVLSNASLSTISDISVSGNYLYGVSSSNNRFVVVDVSNPASMSLTGTFTNATTMLAPTKVAALANGYVAVILSTANRLIIMNVSTPSAPVVHSNTSNSGFNLPREIVAVGNDLLVLQTGAIRKWNCSNPLIPSFVWLYSGSVLDINDAQDLVVQDGYAYIVSATVCRLVIMDITGSSTPTIFQNFVDTVNLRWPRSVDVVGSTVVVESYHDASVTVLTT